MCDYMKSVRLLVCSSAKCFCYDICSSCVQLPTYTHSQTHIRTIHIWAHAHTHGTHTNVLMQSYRSRPPWLSVRKFVCRNRRSYTVLTSSNSPIRIVITVCLFPLDFLNVHRASSTHQNCRNRLKIFRIKYEKRNKNLKLETLISPIKWTWK